MFTVVLNTIPNRELEKSYESKEKTLTCFVKSFQFSNKKPHSASTFNLGLICQQHNLIILTQYETNGLLCKTFVLLGNLKSKTFFS